MSVHSLRYQGKLNWNNEEYSNPNVFFSELIIPYGKDLVVIRNQDGTIVIEPFKKQNSIVGVVIQVTKIAGPKAKLPSPAV